MTSSRLSPAGHAPCTHAYSLMNRCNKHMESSEENIKLRSITGGCLHKRSFVFHIEYDGNFWISRFQWPFSCLRYQKKGCPSRLTLGFMDCISKYIDVTEVDHGNRTRFVINFKNEAFSSPELRNVDNFWVVNGKMSHCSGCTLLM